MKESNKYDIALFLLVSSIMFGTIGGALTPSRLLTILLLPMLLKRIRNCGYVKPFLCFFLFFYVWCIVSIIWTPDIIQGAKELVYYPIHFLYFFELLVFSKYANNSLKSISWGWAVAMFLCSFVAIWELMTDNHLSMAMQDGNELNNVGDAIVQHMTASVTFHNPNSYVTHICYSFPWVVYLLLTRNRHLIKTAVLLYTIIIMIVVIIFNASRGGILSFLIMGIVYFLFSPKSISKTIMTFFIGAIILYVIINYGQDAILIMQARASDGGLTHDNARFGIWSVTFNILVNYLFVGVGIGGATAALQNASSSIVASTHSLLFEILLQYGVLFTLIFLVFVFRLFKFSWYLNDTNRRIVLLMSLFALPAYSIIDSVYLVGVDIFALLGTMYIFIHIDHFNNKTICKQLKLV